MESNHKKTGYLQFEHDKKGLTGKEESYISDKFKKWFERSTVPPP
jgi:hypothetical protein